MTKRDFFVMVSGLPGSGKSYFASRLAKELSAIYLSSDIIRKGLFAHPAYTPAEKDAVYGAMLEKLSNALDSNETVVIDATFYSRNSRAFFLQFADFRGIKPKIICITADEELVRKRVAVKRTDSDADFEVYRKIKELYEPFEEPHLQLTSTDNNIEEMIKAAINYIKCD